MGAEVPEAIITPESLRYNFTNEGGAGGTFRFCKNIMGLWLVQECRRWWAAHGEEWNYTELTQMAAEAQPFVCVVDPDHGDFLKPGDMPARIRSYAARTGQLVPETKGEIVRSALEGIALKYRYVLEKAEEILGHRLEPIRDGPAPVQDLRPIAGKLAGDAKQLRPLAETTAFRRRSG